MYKLITVAALFGSAAAEIVAYDPTKCVLTGEALTKFAAGEDVKKACGPCVGASASAECATWFSEFANALSCGDNAHCIQKAETEAAAAKKVADAAAAKAVADKKAAEEKAAADAKTAALKNCPTDKAKCSNKDSYCSTWAKNNQCISNSEWMIPNCAGSCCPLCNGEADKVAEATCPTDTQTASCKADVQTSCVKWAEMGECTKNTKWMTPNCMASCCDTCNRAADGCPAVKKLCTDDHDADKCAAWAEKGECTKNPKFMNKNCSKSCCTLCQPKAPAKTVAAPVSFAAPISNYATLGTNYGYGGLNTANFGATLPYTSASTLGYGGLNTGVWGR